MTNKNISILSKQSKQEKEFWLNKLSSPDGGSHLLLDHERSNSCPPHNEQVEICIPADSLAKLAKLTGNSALLTYTVLLTALKICLHKYSGSAKVAVGSPARRKSEEDSQPTNAVTIVTEINDQVSIQQLLTNVRQNLLDAYANQAYPFEQLLQALKLSDVSNRCPLFEVAAVMNGLHLPLPAVNNDITFIFSQNDGNISGDVHYSSSLFNKESIEKLTERFAYVLGQVLDNTSACVSAVSLVSDAERDKLLVEWNRTQTDYASSSCIHDLFHLQVERCPDATAIVCENQSLTYRELHQRSNQLAHYLQKLGVGPETIVGISTECSLEMITAVLGTLKAGGAYLPLDPSHPKQRLAYMLTTTRPSVLLTQQRLMEKLPSSDARIVCLDTEWPNIAGESEQTPISQATPDNLAYIIFTSGSTGQPKGVAVPHRGLCNVSVAQALCFGVQSSDRILQFTSLNFDVSFYEIIMALCSGATLCVPGQHSMLVGSTLVEVLRNERITNATLPPAVLMTMPVSSLPELKTLISAGDECPAELVERWAGGREFFNAYGPTEITIWATVQKCAQDHTKPSMGTPITNTRIYILDHKHSLAPVGIPGEIYIGGVGVARGYLNHADLTAERYVPDGLSGEAGARLYKTGDLARYRANGEIEFLGRIDGQIKLRGFRIELGEIEKALREEKDVADATVIVRGDTAEGERLVAYVVGTNHSAPNAGKLRNSLGERLPEYMVPSFFVLLDALPLNVNGKLDRDALPAPQYAGTDLEDTYAAPQTPVEEMLCGIWAGWLELEQVGVDDNFFGVGGHSLLATAVISEVREVFGVELPVTSIFDKPTVRELAREIETALEAHDDSPLTPRLQSVSREGPLPLSFAQQRLWFIDQLEPGNPFYNLPIARRLRGTLNVEALREALTEIVRRHEVLRTSFTSIDGQPLQVIAEPKPLHVPVTDLSDLPLDEREAETRRQLHKELRQPFDLQCGPVFRVQLLKLTEDEHVLLLTLHHVAGDAWSMGVLFRELSALYNAFSEGRPSPLAELPVQYADYAAWQRQYLQGEVFDQQLNYWKEHLGGAPGLLELPSDRTRPAVQTYKGASMTFSLPKELSLELKQLSQREGVTLFMTLLAAFQVLLSRYSGQEDIVVGSPIAGRNRKETEALIGLFVNTLALRVDLSGEPTFQQVLAGVRKICLGAYAHQDIPFERLVEELRPERSLSHQPLFQVMFHLQEAEREQVFLNGLNQQGLNQKLETAKFDLLLAMDNGETLGGLISYNTDLFDAETVRRMWGHFQQLLQSAVLAPEQRIGELQLLTAAEHQQLVDSNEGVTDDLHDVCIHHLFEQQAARTPDAIALIYQKEQLTYRELNARANRLAHHLVKQGVGPESLVGVLLDRSTALPVALLAILKAGAAYLPLDPAYPPERLSFMLEDANAQVVVTQQKLRERVAGTDTKLICVDIEAEEIDGFEKHDVVATVTGANLAYVIYTSGSTGRPKGVAITHKSAVVMLHWARRAFSEDELQCVLFSTSICFDLSVFELFAPLSWGGSVLVVENALALAMPPDDSPPTLINTVPSAMTELLRVGGVPRNVQVVNLAGEALSGQLVEGVYELPQIKRVWNLYGPTEDTTYSTGAVMSRKGRPTIGRPLDGTRAYVMDQWMGLVPVGVSGELYLGGEGLARGYLGRAELTADRFVPDPFSKKEGARLYRTGDVVRYLPDGQLEFLGRGDQQVKLRGYRIELGEVEAVLTSHDNVRTAAVIALGSGSDARLVAYVISSSPDSLNIVALRDYMRSKLPEYMVPDSFLQVDDIPLTRNGKIDWRALSSLKAQPARMAVDEIMPRTEIEERVAQAWRDLLQVERVSVNSNFFDIGGHSLLLTRLVHELGTMFPGTINLIDLFKYPTIEGLAEFISKQLAGEQEEADVAPAPKASVASVSTNFSDESVAIIGLSCRVPGASNAEHYWENLREGRETISHFSDEELRAAGVTPELLAEPNYVKAKGILEGIEMFDAPFFGFTPKEAEIMDPQHRLFLECAWEALEAAGYDPERYPGRIGVYAGQTMSSYMLRLMSDPELMSSVGQFPIMLGNREDFLATRICYKLNLRGPGVVVQTACSTSLVAVAMACQSLLQGQADIALAGGVSVTVPQKSGHIYQPDGISSPDGHCRAFDDRAQGSVKGDGLGVVVLKRLSDALSDGDVIRAVIRGAAINNDGSLKIGYTAPSVDGQSEVIAMAHSQAKVNPEMISYVEAHGTGTALGDPIEIAALTQAFRLQTEKNAFCAIGSVKTNLGHLDTAAGVAGLIKTVLALEHKQLPPSLHFERPNSQIDFANSPFYVNATLREWPRNGTPRRAGVSSFGIGGTNAHIVLEEAPAVNHVSESRPKQLLTISARSNEALERATRNLSDHLRQRPDDSLADIAYTLAVGRKAFNHRRMLVCDDLTDAINVLDTLEPKRVFTSIQAPQQRPVAFMFPGQGAQYVSMGRRLYETEVVFREQLDQCALLLEPYLGLDLREVLYPNSDATKREAALRLRQTSLTQPALFAIEYALAQLWMSWGVRPAALIGHSIGEYVAACLAGVFSLDDALRLVVARGRLMQEMPAGEMLVVNLSESELSSLLNPRVSLASVNTPTLCVVAGPAADVSELEAELGRRDVATTHMHTSHAFHSWMMEGALEPFAEEVKRTKLSRPKIPFVSNLKGSWITAEEATDPGYWVRQLRDTVRFNDGVKLLFKEANMVLLEVGPGRSLLTLARRHPAKSPDQIVLNSLVHPAEQSDELTVMLNSLGRLWLSGGVIDWAGFYAYEQRRRAELPTYPFERKRYWIEPRKPRRPQNAALQMESNGNGNHETSEAWQGLSHGLGSLQELESKVDESLVGSEREHVKAPAHQRPRLSSEYEGPTNELERAIVKLWEELLGVSGIGIHDSFFELDGHSLLGTMLMTRLRKMFKVELALRTLFEGPTVAELALAIEESLIVAIGDVADDTYQPTSLNHPHGETSRLSPEPRTITLPPLLA
ncbi:MAG TPA: amino acid adenylation domain-containing protein [Pyrinomonadaceae bacterium]|nr:amino acid adenylation domain-containing protein [Pyrinomonadaceae bacterium]